MDLEERLNQIELKLFELEGLIRAWVDALDDRIDRISDRLGRDIENTRRDLENKIYYLEDDISRIPRDR